MQRRLALVVWLTLAAVSAWHLAHLITIVASRLTFPIDIEWLEGGSLLEARRIVRGEPVYTMDPTGFVPYPYPPVYFALLALLGRVTGSIGYVGARLLSFLPLAAVVFFAARAVRDHGRAAGLSAKPAMACALACAALVASAYPAALGFYDIARPDALAAAFATASVLTSSSAGARGWTRPAASAGLMALALYTKQTHVVLAVAVGGVHLARSAAAGAAYFGILGALSGAALFALDHATGGAFPVWIFGLRHQPFDYGKLLEGAERLAVDAPHLVLIALAGTWGGGWLSPRTRAWVVAAAAALPSALVPYAKIGGAANNFLPVLVMAGPAAVLVLLDAVASRRLPATLAATALAGLLAGQAYPGDFFRPTRATQSCARTLVATVASLDGDVLSPLSPYLPIVAGHDSEQVPLLSHFDAVESRFPGVRSDSYLAYVRKRAPRWIVVAKVDEDYLRPVLAEDYVVARVLEAPDVTGAVTPPPQRIYERRSDL